MSLVSMATVRALASNPLSDDDLQTVIDREEAWLARRIGPLGGLRTQTLWIRSGDGYGPRYLQRYTDAVEVVDGGTTLSADGVRLLANGSAIERVSGAWAGPSIKVTYEPNDEDDVIAAVIELVALGMSVGAMESERLGSYSYKRPNHATRRTAIVRSLTPRPGSGTLSVRWDGRSDRTSTVGVVP